MCTLNNVHKVAESEEPPRKKKGTEAIMENSNQDLLLMTSGGGGEMAEFSDDSPDIFADCSPMDDKEGLSDVCVQEDGERVCNNATEQLRSDSERVWCGASLDEIRNGSAPCLPPITPSHSHSVFFQLPFVSGQPLKPHPSTLKDCWDSNHVRMPCSEHSLYPVQESGRQSRLRQRWELVQEALLKNIVSSQQLEAVILSYNSKYSERWDFNILHIVFMELFSEEETNSFFTSLLPQIVQLALQLPQLLTAPVPLLVQHRNHSLSFSQLQIASLLANAFLCTFPRRNTAKRQSEYAQYPDINFNRLYQVTGGQKDKPKYGKLKCLLHYFRRVCSKAPDGVVTFTRRYQSRANLPQWDRSQKLLTKLHVTSEGTIENDGEGLLQVDFANRMIGGGVLGRGCVQEEIRFVICPELIVSRLFTEALDATEALVIVGCERFSNYSGYGDSFEWIGDHRDNTPRDSSGRRLCAVVAIDALKLGNRNVQYTPSNLLRELNKAYVGFYSPESELGDRLAGVASGNWGCGAFRGDTKLKTLLQLMAASQAGRHLAYFTFGDKKLRDEVYHLYTYLVDKKVTVGELWRLLCQYYEHGFRGGRLVADLYPFLYQAVSKKSRNHSSTSSSSKEQIQPRVTKCEVPHVQNKGVLNHKQVEEALLSEVLICSDDGVTKSVNGSTEPQKDVTQRVSLLECLEQCDRPTTPKRKISDYFAQAPRPK